MRLLLVALVLMLTACQRQLETVCTLKGEAYTARVTSDIDARHKLSQGIRTPSADPLCEKLRGGNT